MRAAAAAAVALLLPGLAACSETASRRGPAPAQALPLAVSAPAAGGAWALVHVGASSGEASLWELLWRPAGASRWTLATPPGVQDSGGLSIATAGRTLVAGFDLVHNLTFSPLAITRDDGATWSPEVLPAGLVTGPDSLAAGADGAIFGLLGRARGEVLARRAGAARFSPLVSGAALAAAAPTRDCGLQTLTAVAVGPAGQALVGGSCARRGAVGVYAQDGAHWQPVAPALPAALRRDPLQLLRLTSVGPSTFVLIETRSRTHADVLAAWSGDGGAHWLESPVLALGAQQLVGGVAVAAGQTALIMADGPRGQSLWASEAPARGWRALARPPRDTATVALDDGRGGGEAEAFTVRGSAIAGWRLPGASRRWRATATLRVPLELSSSE